MSAATPPALRPTFPTAAAFRARNALLLGLFLLPFSYHVLHAFFGWSTVGSCLVNAAEVRRSGEGFVPWLQVDVQGGDTCVVGVEVTAPLPSREAASARLTSFPPGAKVPCFHVPGACGAAIEKPFMGGWLALPVLTLALIGMGVAGRWRGKKGALSAPVAGPFRTAPARETRPDREVFLPRSGWGTAVFAVPLAVLPGLLGFPAMVYIFFELPLHETGFTVLVLVVAGVTAGLLFGGLVALFSRPRLYISRENLAGFRAWGVGSLDLGRRYVSFSSLPQAEVRARTSGGRRPSTVYDVVLSDGHAELLCETFYTPKEAEPLRLELTTYFANDAA